MEVISVDRADLSSFLRVTVHEPQRRATTGNDSSNWPCKKRILRSIDRHYAALTLIWRAIDYPRDHRDTLERKSATRFIRNFPLFSSSANTIKNTRFCRSP